MAPVSERAERLRRAGLKVTGPRLAILEAVERDRSHPSAEEIHRSLKGTNPSMSLSTVYLTLASFARAGLARKLPEVDGRLRVDGTVDEHDHAICRRCGTIFDVDRRDVSLPSSQDRLPEGFEVLGVSLEYDVICSSCTEEQPNQT